MLWDYFKHLKNKAPIYMDVMDEDANSIPQAYVVLEEKAYDDGFADGDGQNLLRRESYNIRIHATTKKKAIELSNLYREVLIQSTLKFSQYGPTYDPSTGYYSILITGNKVYGV